MKRKIWISLLLAVSVILLCLSAGSAENSPVLTLSTESAEIGIGGKLKVTYTLEAPPELGKPTAAWSSMDTDIADVKNGNITGKSAGETQIWLEISYNDGTVCSGRIDVKVFKPVSGLTTENKTLTVGVGFSSDPLAITVKPEDAEYKGVVWSSNKEDIATVDANGVVTGVAPGKAVITAASSEPAGEGAKPKSCSINVTVVQYCESVALEPAEIRVSIGKTEKVTGTVSPENATNQKLTWESENPEIATVKGGQVRGVAVGTTKIYAVTTDGSEKRGECLVTVVKPVKKLSFSQKEVTVIAGQPYTPVVKVEPEDASIQELDWTSADPEIVRADENGTLTGLKEGTCVVTASARDGSGASAALKLVVEPYIDLSMMQKTTLSVGNGFALGIREDGTVIAAGDNDDKQLEVDSWSDIVSVSCGLYHSVGLMSNGHVVAAGMSRDNQCDVSGWKGIIAIAAGSQHTVGLKSDGTVVAVGSNEHGQCNVSGWTNIKAIAVGSWHTLGLREDGTVVAVGYNEYGQCNVSGWKDIVALDGGDWASAGVTKNGRVVFAGGWDSDDKRILKRTEEWTGIVSIDVDDSAITAVDKDGKVYCTSGINFPEGTYIQAYLGTYNNYYTAQLTDGTVKSRYKELDGVRVRLPETKAEIVEEKKSTDTGIWLIGDFVDEFGSKTGEHYVGHRGRLKGTFDNAFQSGASLQVVMLYSRENYTSGLSGIYEYFNIELYEYDDNLVKNPYSKERKYRISVQDGKGFKYSLSGKIYSDSYRLYLDDSSITTLLGILKAGGEVRFHITEVDDPLTVYRFSIPDATGFEAVYDQYITMK